MFIFNINSNYFSPSFESIPNRTVLMTPYVAVSRHLGLSDFNVIYYILFWQSSEGRVLKFRTECQDSTNTTGDTNHLDESFINNVWGKNAGGESFILLTK